MKKLLLFGAGLLSLCTVGLTTAKAGEDYYRRGDNDYYRPRQEYRERCDDRDYYPRRRVVVREYYTPRYYTDDCRPRYYHRRRPHVSISLPLPPLPFLPF